MFNYVAFDNKKQQQLVWKKICAALALLQKARELEGEIENDKAMQSNNDFSHIYPLGRNLEAIIKNIEELL